jgi:hypothetical protein
MNLELFVGICALLNYMQAPLLIFKVWPLPIFDGDLHLANRDRLPNMTGGTANSKMKRLWTHRPPLGRFTMGQARLLMNRRQLQQDPP